jgi:hypothetical protein
MGVDCYDKTRRHGSRHARDPGLPGHKSHKSTEIYTALSPDRFNEFVERPRGR